LIAPRHLFLLACLIPALAAAADDQFGRLFLTPAERSNLDYLRQSSKPPEKIIAADQAMQEDIEKTAPSPAAPSAVTMQGYVKRSDGKGTVWVNRQPVQEKSRHGEIEVGKLGASDDRVRVKVPGTSQTVDLKAGQTYDPISGKVVDNARELPKPEVAAVAPTPEKKSVVEGESAKPEGQQSQPAPVLPPAGKKP
jgi:hypothetical protein